MIEEKKEEKPVEAPQASPPAAEQVKKPEEKKDVKPKKEKPSNCAACNKSIKKKRWYYRNGKYYCTKRCWKTTVKKEEKPKDAEKGTST